MQSKTLTSHTLEGTLDEALFIFVKWQRCAAVAVSHLRLIFALLTLVTVTAVMRLEDPMHFARIWSIVVAYPVCTVQFSAIILLHT